MPGERAAFLDLLETRDLRVDARDLSGDDYSCYFCLGDLTLPGDCYFFELAV